MAQIQALGAGLPTPPKPPTAGLLVLFEFLKRINRTEDTEFTD
jgi:hypothetical protein